MTWAAHGAAWICCRTSCGRSHPCASCRQRTFGTTLSASQDMCIHFSWRRKSLTCDEPSDRIDVGGAQRPETLTSWWNVTGVWQHLQVANLLLQVILMTGSLTSARCQTETQKSQCAWAPASGSGSGWLAQASLRLRQRSCKDWPDALAKSGARWASMMVQEERGSPREPVDPTVRTASSVAAQPFCSA